MNKLNDYKNISTPFYAYDLGLLQATITAAKQQAEKYGYHIHYALKANSNPEILQLIQQAGFGADCVSGNEVLKAKEVGFESSKIAFAGVGKTDREINIGLQHAIFSFNCESIQEMQVINQLAKERNTTANVAIRINPNVDAKTHKHITTGLGENKFGISEWQFDELISTIQSLTFLHVNGIHFHIGSQITDLTVFKNLCIRVNELLLFFKEKGVEFEYVNVGGGLGINYKHPNEELIPNFENYFSIFHNNLSLQNNQPLHFELGRSIVAQCGELITKVLYVKEAQFKQFVIIDAGMTELMRPALYDAQHNILNLTSKSEQLEKYDIVGPICESTDSFARNFEMPTTQRGDLLCIQSAGAYGEVLSNRYNLRDKVNAYYFR